MKLSCRHPWKSLSLIYSGNGCLVERIECAKCNAELFPKTIRGNGN